ncbi:MAG: hypothetical protein WC934_02060 [Acidithiobacillus sp.]|jgi:cytochrome c biogenesis protein CcdA|uniref:hypothetical protein n=1 Tax=Acidithiobacillus sp. TaxID=1872118 RepID=UPI00355D557D
MSYSNDNKRKSKFCYVGNQRQLLSKKFWSVFGLSLIAFVAFCFIWGFGKTFYNNWTYIIFVIAIVSILIISAINLFSIYGSDRCNSEELRQFQLIQTDIGYQQPIQRQPIYQQRQTNYKQPINPQEQQLR